MSDEMSVKVRGNLKWLFALLDDETRFWIAKEVANIKFDHDTKPLFRMGKEIAGKKPRVLITDGLMAYHEGYLKEFYTPADMAGIKVLGENKWLTLIQNAAQGRKQC